MMHYMEMYTDGACVPNPGPGSWGLVLLIPKPSPYEKHEIYSGFVNGTTNNRMELLAVIEGFTRLKKPAKVSVFSDSQYVINTMSQGWQRNKNVDLWSELDSLIKPHSVTWVWIAGHSGIFYNDACHDLCVSELKKHGVTGYIR